MPRIITQPRAADLQERLPRADAGDPARRAGAEGSKPQGPSYFSPFLEPRRTIEKAVTAVIQEAWIAGVSTRRVEDLVQAMGMSRISKSQVSKLCKDIDERQLLLGTAAGRRLALRVA